MTTHTNEWEKRYEEEIGWIKELRELRIGNESHSTYNSLIKSFISQVEQRAIERTKKAVREEIKTMRVQMVENELGGTARYLSRIEVLELPSLQDTNKQ